MLSTTIALLAMLASGPAEAGVRVDVTLPGFHVVVDPWSPHWVPAHRPGWVWIAGWYDSYGYWHPGYWRPVAHRPGWIWVPGYWAGSTYIDGYWREEYRAGYTWSTGYYLHGRWIAGGWRAYTTPMPRGYHHHHGYSVSRDRADGDNGARDRAEDRRDREEDRRDRAEDRRDRRR